MSRLPLTFANRAISFRIPFSMASTLAVAPNQNGFTFPEASFLHNIDKPFEIHRVIIRLTATGIPPNYSAEEILEPQPTTLDERIYLNIYDFSKNERLTKIYTQVSLLLNQLTGAWDFDEPYTLVRSEGFSVSVDSDDYPVAVVLGVNPTTPSESTLIPTAVAVDFVDVEVCFQGYLIVIAPPSETR